jgi:hypothetical protein
MLKMKGVLAGALLALVLVYNPAMNVQAEQPETISETDISIEATDNVVGRDVGRYTEDGGKTWIPVREVKGVVERIPAGTSQAEFMETHRMTPEAEAKIVHTVPQVPVIIDGIRYEPEQIHLFDGRQLGFTVGQDGQLYAFTSYKELENFLADSRIGKSAILLFFATRYSEGAWYDGPRHLEVDPGVTWHYLSYALMDNIFSSMEINATADNGVTLFDLPNLQGDYFHGYYGTPYPNLGTYGWNDRASSLVVWPQ